VLEQALSGAFGIAGLDPQFFEAVADGVEREGEKVHGGEQHGQVLFAVAEIVLKMIAVVFQYVEGLVLDFPPCPGAPGNLGDIFAGNLETGDERAIVGGLAAGVGDGSSARLISASM
jgi:hypothetical protein